MSNERTVLLQVPIPGNIADEISRCADRMDRPFSWMGAQLIEQGVRDRTRIAEWLGALVVGSASKVLRPISREEGGRARETVRVKVWVSERLAAEVEELGRPLRLNQVQMAGVLLECAMRDHKLPIEVVTTWAGKAFARRLFGKGSNMRKGDEATA